MQSTELLEGDDVALVHDYLLVLRGAERTFAAIADIWPDAPVYTLLYDEDATGDRFATHSVETSALQRLQVGQSGFRKLLPLFPLMAERLPVQQHRVVVSSSSAFAHGVRPAPAAVHVCYCHSPFRYAWFERERALREVSSAVRPALRAALAAIRRWDVKASTRVTRYVANSRYTQQRILQLYGRHANIVHPPVEVDRFRTEEPEDYFVTVGEVVPHKRVELAAQAALAAGKRLKVVGSGPALDRMREQYGRRVEFLGRVEDEELERIYAGALAAVVPNTEEFGIVAVEAQAAGRPVIAARAGGSIETVVDGVTGCFVPPDDSRALERAMRRFDHSAYDSETIQRHSRRFSPQAFRSRLRAEVELGIAEGRAAERGTLRRRMRARWNGRRLVPADGGGAFR